jgi:hypothetical protein
VNCYDRWKWRKFDWNQFMSVWKGYIAEHNAPNSFWHSLHVCHCSICDVLKNYGLV